MGYHVVKTMSCLPSPSHHHVYRWYVYHSQSWVVYGIVLTTLLVGGFNHLEKILVNGKDYPIYYGK